MFIDGGNGGRTGDWKRKTPKFPGEMFLSQNQIQKFPKGSRNRDGKEGRERGHTELESYSFENPHQIPALCGGVCFFNF